jgi:hypothetical protein
MSQTTNLINLDVNAVTLAKPHDQLLEQDAVPKSYITSQIATLIGGAPESLDTLSEIASGILENGDSVDAINQLISTEIEVRATVISTETLARETAITIETASLAGSISSTLSTETLAINGDISEATAGLQTGITTLENEQGAINTSISNEVSARGYVVALLSQEIVAEETARIAAIASASTLLNTEVQSLSTIISTETTDRQNAVTALSTSISQETTDRQTGVSYLSTSISTETSERQAAVTALSADIVQERSERQAAVESLNTSIDQERSDREAAVAYLSADIVQEITDRQNAVTALSTSISQETTDREDAITSETAARAQEVENMDGTISTEFSVLNDTTNDLSTTLNSRLDTLGTRISQETTDRQADVTALITSIDEEVNNRQTAVAQLNTVISNATADHTTDISSAREAKLDRSNKYSKRYDYNFAVAENEAYLYIGNSWRIAAGNSETRKKLTFEYSADGINWKLGLPFFKDIVRPDLDFIFKEGDPLNVNMHMLAPAPIEDLRTKVGHAYKFLETSPDPKVMSLNTYQAQDCTFSMSIEGYSTAFANTNKKGCNTRISSLQISSWPGQWRNHEDINQTVSTSGQAMFQLRDISVTSEKTFSGILVYNDDSDLTNKFVGFDLGDREAQYLTLGSSTTASRVYFNILPASA